MINFNKNKLINKTLDKYYETFSRTLDTADFVPQKFNDKISKYIYKNMRKALRQIDKEDRIFQKQLKIKEKISLEKTKTKKYSLFKKLIIWFRFNFLKRKHRLLTYEDKEKMLSHNSRDCGYVD